MMIWQKLYIKIGCLKVIFPKLIGWIPFHHSYCQSYKPIFFLNPIFRKHIIIVKKMRTLRILLKYANTHKQVGYTYVFLEILPSNSIKVFPRILQFLLWKFWKNTRQPNSIFSSLQEGAFNTRKSSFFYNLMKVKFSFPSTALKYPLSHLCLYQHFSFVLEKYCERLCTFCCHR